MKKKILLVDDKFEFRMLVKIILADKYEVNSAEDGFEALALLQTGYSPDIIISDLMMPQIDGKAFVSHLKASGLFSHIPVIILSSIDKSYNKIELIEAGAKDYLIKPFNPRELEIRIENQLN